MILSDASSRFFENVDAYVLDYNASYQRREDSSSHQSDKTRPVPSILIVMKVSFQIGGRFIQHTQYTVHKTLSYAGHINTHHRDLIYLDRKCQDYMIV
jgi:hypothetical protein